MGNRRGDNRQLVARLNRCSSPRRSPVVYTRGDCRGDRPLNILQAIVDDRSDSHGDDRPVYTPYKLTQLNS